MDSAGTGAWHIGGPPDERSQESARKRGIDLGAQRARQVTPGDCQRFEYVIAMGQDNYAFVSELCSGLRTEVRLFMEYAPDSPQQEIPDPYFGGPDGFEHALNLVEEAARGLLDDVRKRHLESRV